MAIFHLTLLWLLLQNRARPERYNFHIRETIDNRWSAIRSSTIIFAGLFARANSGGDCLLVLKFIELYNIIGRVVERANSDLRSRTGSGPHLALIDRLPQLTAGRTTTNCRSRVKSPLITIISRVFRQSRLEFMRKFTRASARESGLDYNCWGAGKEFFGNFREMPWFMCNGEYLTGFFSQMVLHKEFSFDFTILKILDYLNLKSKKKLIIF